MLNIGLSHNDRVLGHQSINRGLRLQGNMVSGPVSDVAEFTQNDALLGSHGVFGRWP